MLVGHVGLLPGLLESEDKHVTFHRDGKSEPAKRTRSLIGAEHVAMSCHLNVRASVILKAEKVMSFEGYNHAFTNKTRSGVFYAIWIQYNFSH